MLNFNFTYSPGTTLQQMVGMEMAGRIWSSYLKDPVTINIHVGMASSSSLPTNVIGGALPGVRAAQRYIDVRDRLVAEAGNLTYTSALAGTSDGRSFDDKVAATQIAPKTKLDAYVEALHSTIGIYNILEDTSVLNVTRANAKAMGLSITDGSNLDGYILFSDLAGATANGQAISWNYNYTGTTASNQLNFLSTAVHEIGHVLGFVSGIDRPGWMTNSISTSNDAAFATNVAQQILHATPLDLFRFSGAGYNEMSHGIYSSSALPYRYFSVDNGATNIADFSTGADTSRAGDGSQASHWKHGLSSIMAPKLRLGTRPNISAIDLRAMDAIGWDLATTTATSAGSLLGTDQQKMVERGRQNATALANTTISFSTLQSNAISALATRAGQTTTWINSNLTNVNAALPTSLRRNRDTDVNTMIQNSQVYNFGSDGDPWWQKMLNLFRAESLFSSVDELEFAPTESSGLADNAVLEAITSDVVSFQGDAQLTPAMFQMVKAFQEMGLNGRSRPSQSVPMEQETLVAAMKAFNAMSTNLGSLPKQFSWLERWDRQWPAMSQPGTSKTPTPEVASTQLDCLADLFF